MIRWGRAIEMPRSKSQDKSLFTVTWPALRVLCWPFNWTKAFHLKRMKNTTKKKKCPVMKIIVSLFFARKFRRWRQKRAYFHLEIIFLHFSYIFSFHFFGIPGYFFSRYDLYAFEWPEAERSRKKPKEAEWKGAQKLLYMWLISADFWNMQPRFCSGAHLSSNVCVCVCGARASNAM